MIWLNFPLVFLYLHFIEIKSIQTFNVMISPAEPFAYFDVKQNTFKGLDVEIIRNFGRKFNLKMNYFVTNETLNNVFSSKNRLDKFLKSKQNS